MLQTVNTLRLAVEEHGAGQPLLLLHGFTGSGASWGEHTPLFAKTQRVITPDLIGHGASDAPADAARYSMEHATADLLGLLDQLGVGQFDLLGYSLGGRIALHLALAAPQRVRKLVLESASPGIADPAERAERVANDNALAAQIEQRGIDWFVEYWENIPLFSSQRMLPPEVFAAQRERRLANRPQGLANSLRGMGAGQQEPLWERLAELGMPTLLIAGELDTKYVGLGLAMQQRIKGANRQVVRGAGHTTHLEQPRAFGKAVQAFFG
jgi:2-succinyl-6-hydroxy-2,4-cyclohexadiene-1-carboxylate synthase